MVKCKVNSVKAIKGEMNSEFSKIKEEMQEIKTDVKDVKERVITMEDDNHKKFTALFDGYKQNSDKLDKIEDEVSKHEEVIIRRIK